MELAHDRDYCVRRTHPFLSIRLIVFAGVSWVLDLGICPV